MGGFQPDHHVSLRESRVSRSEHRVSGVSLLGWTHQN